MSDIGHNGAPPVSGRFIIYHVEWLDHPLVGRANPLYAFYWLDLLCSCNYCEGSIRVNGFHFDLKPGEMVGATSFLAHRWGTTPSKVRTFIDHLVSYHLLDKRKSNPQDRKQKGKAPQVLSVPYYKDLGMGQATDGTNKIASKTTSRSQAAHQQVASRSPELNKETNKQINNIPPNPQRGNSDDFPSHVQPVTNWNTAFAQPDQDGFVFGGPQGVQLVNGTHQFWLEQFDGDQKALGLALIKAAASVQPNSKQNRVQQIVRMLSSEAAAKHNSDQRYAKAAGKKAKSAKDVDIFAIMREMTGD